ncbi:MAG: putative esterase YcpF (UPF0227 family) [Paraglaciecola sp.]|jgi:predicted esterase YcpF (UPF0227 family)
MEGNMQQTIIYLHGFLSSPQSHKAQTTQAYVTAYYPELHLVAPQLPNHPQAAMSMLCTLVEQHQGGTIGFIGSSMGGYFSSFLREKYGGKAVLINPAVQPYHLLADYLGDHVNPYTGQTFTLETCHINELSLLDTQDLSKPENYWVLLQSGDETLDYRQAQHKYQQGKLTLEPGGDHSFQGYERFLPDIFRFLLQDEMNIGIT